MKLNEQDQQDLLTAFERLEHPSLVVRLSTAFGLPVETVAKEIGKRVPDGMAESVGKAAHKALEVALKGSLRTVSSDAAAPARPALHTAAAATTGAVSGFFGAPALAVELPLTTAIMFRSMADIARAEGELPDAPETMVNVMQVFALGSGSSLQDDAAETSYYGVRLALAKLVSEAMQHVARHGARSVSAPALIKLIATVAGRFGMTVTQKAMAQAVPVIGAVGGGLVNTVFISHFQDIARGHFTIRRLERAYSVGVVQDAYQALKET